MLSCASVSGCRVGGLRAREILFSIRVRTAVAPVSRRRVRGGESPQATRAAAALISSFMEQGTARGTQGQLVGRKVEVQVTEPWRYSCTRVRPTESQALHGP